MPPTTEYLQQGVISEETLPVVLAQLRALIGDGPFAVYTKNEPTFNPLVLRLDHARGEPVARDAGPEGRLGIRLYVTDAKRYVDILSAWSLYDEARFAFGEHLLRVTTMHYGEMHTHVVLALRAPVFAPPPDEPGQPVDLITGLLQYHNAHNGELTRDTVDEYATRLADAMVGHEVLYSTPGHEARLGAFAHLQVKAIWLGFGDDTRLYIEFTEGPYEYPGAHLFLLRFNNYDLSSWPQATVNMHGDGSIILGTVGPQYARQDHAYFPLPPRPSA